MGCKAGGSQLILLDTNVLSELRKAAGGTIDRAVLAWAEDQDAHNFWLSAVTIQEVEFGILAAGRNDLEKASVFRAWLEDEVLTGFAARILPFDTSVARACAALHLPQTRPQRDAMIAATALVHGLAIATRNTRDFAGTGVRLVNPWDYRVGTGSGPA